MELKVYLGLLWRRKWIIILTMAIVGSVVALLSRSMVAEYVATATLWVPASRGDSVGSGDILLNDRLINTYAELSNSRPVLAELERRLNVPPAEIKDRIKAGSLAQTELLQLSVQHSNPELAAAAATNLAEIVIEQTQRTDAGRTLRVSLFTAAGVPTIPTWMGLLPSPYWREINIVLGLLIGLLGGVALAFLFEYVDSSLHTSKQIEGVAQLPLIGEIPVQRKVNGEVLLNGNTLSGEAFRYLRTSIFVDSNTAPRTLLITSALPGEGKSTIVANLAAAIAQAGRSVIVVDADLRLPSQHKIFNLSNNTGLSTLLNEQANLDTVLRVGQVPGVQVVTSGPVPARPAELLDSPRITGLLEQLQERAEFVLIDTPAVLAVTDAVVLSALVDGVLLVVDRRRAHRETVETARHYLESANARLMGIVVNHAHHDGDHFYRYVSDPRRTPAKTATPGE